MTSYCPCCGQKVEGDGGLSWDVNRRILTGRGQMVHIPEMRARIFDALWRARKHGTPLSQAQLMDIVYADDPSGGPESRNIISVQMLHLKKLIAPFNLTVTRYTGYLLVEKPKSIKPLFRFANEAASA